MVWVKDLEDVILEESGFSSIRGQTQVCMEDAAMYHLLRAISSLQPGLISSCVNLKPLGGVVNVSVDWILILNLIVIRFVWVVLNPTLHQHICFNRP